MIDIKHFEILMSVANLVLNIFQVVGPNGYEDVAMKFFNNVMYKLKDSPDEYTYYNIRTPWLQIKIMKIVQCINPNLFNPETLKHIKDYIEYIGKKTHEVISHDFKFSRFYSHYCVFFEAVNLIDHMNLKLNANIFEKYKKRKIAQILRQFQKFGTPKNGPLVAFGSALAPRPYFLNDILFFFSFYYLSGVPAGIHHNQMKR